MSRRGRVPTHTMLTSSVRLATVIRIIRKPSSVLTARRVHHQHHTQARLLAGPSDAQQFGSAVQSLRSVLPRRPCVRFPARGDCHPFPQPAGSCGHQYVFLAVRHSCTGDSRSTDGLWAALGRTRTAGGIRFNQQPREHESALAHCRGDRLSETASTEKGVPVYTSSVRHHPPPSPGASRHS
jgi:hypothetical protein